MKTISDIKHLSHAHPVIDFCLQQIESGNVSESEALIEMVLHLAQNLEMVSHMPYVQRMSDLPVIDDDDKPAEKTDLPVDSVSTLKDDLLKAEPLTVGTPEFLIHDLPAAEPKSERLRALDSQWEGPKTSEEPRQPKIDIRTVESKKKRGWPW